MSTIAYDRPVRDLIAGLDATGHVTHTQHRKDMVTVHHNGGRLTHDGVLSVWQTRPASAHFDVDAWGGVAQYVRVNEYAWATGSTEGNQRSISIEMCNSDVGGVWPVSEITWRSAARLAGWLFARVIGVRPNSGNLVQHKYWSSTDCAGPYMGSIWSSFIAVAQEFYDATVSGSDEEDEMWLDEEARRMPDGGRPITWRELLLSMDDNGSLIRDTVVAPMDSAEKTYKLAPRDAWAYVDYVQVKVDALTNKVDNLAAQVQALVAQLKG